ELVPLAAALVEGGVRRDPVDPAPQGRASREGGALRRDRQEDVLDDLLRVALIPCDAEGEPIDARGVLAHQRLERRGVATPEPLTPPSTLSLGHPFAVLIDSILSIWRDSTLTCRKSRAVRGRRGILAWSALCRSVRRPASKFRGERSERTVLRPRNFVVSLAKPGAWSSRSVQLLADGPKGSSLRRRIRSFSIRLRSVLGWSFKIFAAPRAPSM